MTNVTTTLLILALTATSCVSWPAKKIAKVEDDKLRSQINTMFIPSVALKFRMYSDRAGKSTEVKDDNVAKEREIFASMIDKTHMVRRIEDEKTADFLIEMQLRSDISKHNQYWLMASAATLTLIPYWGKTFLTGQLTLKDRGGKLLKSYDAKDQFTFMINMFLAPAVPFYFSQTIEQEVRVNLYKHLIARLVKDGIQVTSE
jgi:hypothetical protein